MRASELRGLNWSNVDLDAGVIHVRQRADAWRRSGPPKSKAGKRDIPLAPIVINTLRDWKSGCPKGDLDLVFPIRLATSKVSRTSGCAFSHLLRLLRYRRGRQAEIRLPRPSPRRGQLVHCTPWMDAKASADRHGAFQHPNDIRPLRTPVLRIRPPIARQWARSKQQWSRRDFCRSHVARNCRQQLVIVETQGEPLSHSVT
jgi:hypothetical protein